MVQRPKKPPYDYPLAEDDWPRNMRPSERTPVGRQAQDARAREIASRDDKKPEHFPKPRGNNITRDKLSDWARRINRHKPPDESPVQKAAKRRLKQR